MSEALFPYQKVGAEWLARKQVALLADEMGVGKSAQAIAACDLIKAERILVLCPAVVRTNWAREFQKFSKHSRTLSVVESSAGLLLKDLTIVSYDLLLKTEISSTLLSTTWDCLILDESHYLKSLDAKRTRAVLGKTGICRRAKRIWALSGTPAPNHPGELWPLLYTFGAIKSPYDKFITEFCNYYIGPHGKQITGSKVSAIPKLKSILSTVILRRKKEDVLKDLPPISYATVVVEPGPVNLEEESSFIQYVFPSDRRKELEDKLKAERTVLEGCWTQANQVHHTVEDSKENYQLLGVLQNSIATLRRYNGLQKVKATVELISEELESKAYEKVVIFAIHRDVIEGLRARLTKFKPVTLYGGTDPSTRQKNIDRFMGNPACQVFIGNIQAAGTGITLTSAHNVVFIEQDWVPGNNAQAAMRCHRIGQSKPVLVRFITLNDPLDEKICAVLRRKTKELTKIFDDR